MDNYQHVFSPLTIGNVQVKNRIATPPMIACMASHDGFVTRELIEFYKSFAKGGAGIVTVGDAAIDFDYARGHLSQLNIGDDRVCPGLSTLVETIQRYGAKISIELNHRGRWAYPWMLDGKNPIGPSPITARTEEIVSKLEGRKPIRVQEMNQTMIDQVIENFAAACNRCLKSGFEMVMIHGGHGHLLAQFASGYANKRTDSYGGSLANRARFPLEVLTAIRERVGNKLALEYRISGDELTPDGMHLEETIEFLKLIQDKIDLVNVSLGLVTDLHYAPYHIQPTYLSHAYTLSYAARIKEALDIPVTCVGSISDLEMAENILAEGKADIIALGRAHIADPDLVNKTRLGRVDDIRPCLRCGSCSENPRNDFPVLCAVNPVAGREIDYRYLRPAEEKKKVVVVGGGPAGMETTLIASSRGHQVTLFEKERELGGALRMAASPSFKGDMQKYLGWLIQQTRRATAEIKLVTEATADNVKAEKPDVLIIALGAEPIIPDVPGINKPGVVLAGDVDMDRVKTGNVVVVVGAGLTGCETALLLARQGKRVKIIDMITQLEVAQDAAAMNQFTLVDLIEQEGIEVITEVKLQEVTATGVLVADKRWNKFKISCDTVVLATGYRSLCEAAQAFQELAAEVYAIGDCASPRNLKSAIHDAFNVAAEI
ncbi:FAD-dependent oxidoreductase [Chloroflexota bacterium]